MDMHTLRLAEHRQRREHRIRQEVAYSVPASGAEAAAEGPKPVSTAERTKNALRPATLDTMIGQETMRAYLRRFIDAAKARDIALPHVLLVGKGGTGKSTVSHVLANEMNADVYEVEAPVSLETLLELRTVMQDRDILRVEEIHQQAIGDRRAKGSSTQPEVLYAAMEDRTITTGTGVLPFPEITVLGTTTDEGLLPDSFIDRFPIKPAFDRYTLEDLGMIAIMSAEKLQLQITVPAALAFARAARGTPRQVNNFIVNASLLLPPSGIIGDRMVEEVVCNLNGMTPDGLTRDMQGMLKFLYERGRRENKDGDVTYQASVNTIATAIGKSRDSKAIALRVEPYLIEEGLVQVGSGGRMLTDAGIIRAQELIGEL
jgi:Holliday junction DNA helicase RuvB